VIFFIALPLALRTMAFPLALLVACATTAAGYAVWLGIAKLIGLEV